MRKEEKIRVVVINEIPSPYRAAQYKYLQETETDFDFHIIYASPGSGSGHRKWKVDLTGLRNVSFLPVKSLLFRGKDDDRQIFITHGVSRLLRRIRPRVTVSMEYNPTSLQALRWCGLHGVPYISLTDGTLYSERNIGFFQRAARKYVMRRADAFIASSTRAKEKIASYPLSGDIFVSYLTVDTEIYRYQRASGGGRNLVCVGSLIRRKGIDLLIRAMKRMKSDCRLFLAGTGAEEENLRELAANLGLTDRISFLGYLQQEQIRELYRLADVFVLPTREDCFGLVILEAMCASLPVVCSQYADGAYDLVEEGVTGCIVDPEAVQGFADKLDKVLTENCPVNKMGMEAYRRVGRFTFEQVGKEFMRAVRSVLREEEIGGTGGGGIS